MNDLEKYFSTMAKRPITKWSNYFEIYDVHFDRYRGTKVNVLEIGIGGGGSLQMWKWYFGAKSKIFGIDNDKEKLFSEAKIKTYQCDAGDSEALVGLMAELPTIDIVIDDGGHTMDQQITAFDTIYPFLADDGIYLCEDVMTSFFPEFGGGAGVKRTFLGYMKKKIDQISAYHSRDQVPMTDFSNSVDGMHFYNGVVVIEKGIHNRPEKISARIKNEKRDGDKD